MTQKDHNNTFSTLFTDIDLGEITEAKKYAVLDEIGILLTQRIILTLIERVDAEKKDAFIQKINENKGDPDKILLFIDHFVEDADDVINNEIYKCKREIETIAQNR